MSDASFKLEERVEILTMLLNHDDISLFTLNTPVRGVSPLCLAAWLDIPQMVRLLSESSRGMIPVNGMDNFGATPLMCTFGASFPMPLSHAPVYRCCEGP